MMDAASVQGGQPRISVLVLNYNGLQWIERCLDSLLAQTFLEQMEIIVADNCSTDGSDKLTAELARKSKRVRFVQLGRNLGYCGGNNEAAKLANGEYLLFLNNDTWAEPTCLEELYLETSRRGAAASGPLVLNYSDTSFQSMGAFGFDLFGLPSTRASTTRCVEVIMPEGCAFLVRRELFERLGGFDGEFFMFSDEFDLSWRVWISGHRAISIPSARLHHRGAAQVNPQGGHEVTEFRTSDTKRFYANRNGLLVLLINGQHVLLALAGLQLAMLFFEAAVSLVLVRRWSHVKRAYWNAVRDCWRLRRHISERRRFVAKLRKVSDWRMLRFLRLRPNRWDEVLRVLRYGAPKVTSR